MGDLIARGLAKKNTVQLAEKANSTDYGELIPPSDFPSLPCSFYRDFDGIIKHNMNFSQYKNGTVLYVDGTLGDDSTGNGSNGSPYKTISKAITIASAGADPAYCIRVKTTRFNRDQVFPDTASISGKTLAIIPDNPTNRLMLTTNQTALSYTQDGTGTWKTTRSAVYSVFDLRNVDIYGVPIPLTNKKTLAECQATPNSWYTDNVDVWVHTSDGLAPTYSNFIVNVSLNNKITLLNNSKFYVENCDFYGGRQGDCTAILGDPATLSGEFCAYNSKFVGGYLRNDGSIVGNGLATADLNRVYLFNDLAAYAGRDGFNHHFANISSANRRQCLVVEYGCTSYKNGLYDLINNNNNCFTCHEGVNILRINNIGFASTGPILADVNGCYSICLDCHMRATLSTAAAYYFDNASAVSSGLAIIKNSDGESPTNAISGDTGFNVKLRNFKGKNIKSDINVTYI